MNNRERFLRAINFESVDRLPIWELVVWWDKTIERWKQEGLPENLEDESDIRDYFGLDRHRRYRIRPQKETYPKVEYGHGTVSDKESYVKIREHLFPEEPFDSEKIKNWSLQQAEGSLVVWLMLEGFFWFPRALLGIERHLYILYDNPDLIHEMNADMLKYNLRALGQFCRICKPDFVVIAEDISYKNGPMISRTLFDEFILPYYRELIPEVKRQGSLLFVDTDGNIDTLVPWFTEIRVDGFVPLEIQAGNDIFELRKNHPQLKIIGGYDKKVMSKGENEMRLEFERILPAMKQGGYILSTDHQVPPEVSLANYKIYLKLLKEYCARASL